MIKILKNLKKKEIMLVIFVFILTISQTYLDLTLPDYMSEITMLTQTSGSEITEILSAGLKMLGCAFGSLLFSIATAIVASKVASNFSYIVRGKIFNKVLDFSMEEINNFQTTSLITRNTNDVTQVQMLIVMGMQMLVKAPITAIWALIKIYNKNITWTVATGVAVGVLMTIVTIILSLAIPRFKKLQVLTDDINKVTKEGLDGLNVIRAYNAEEYQSNKFEKANENLTETNLFTSRAMSFLMPTIQCIMSSLVLSIYVIGAVLIHEAYGLDKITLFSDMVVFSSYAMQVIMSFMMLVIVFMILPRASVSAKRINEVLDTDIKIIPGSKEEGLKNLKGSIEFKNVNFKYPDGEDYVLKNINFTANKGEVVAIIGSTGSGKSTIVNLIPRFYDVYEGEILINGLNVKEYDKKSLNSLIGYVSQKAMLFSGTIQSNITYGKTNKKLNDKKRLTIASETSCSNTFIENLDDKYNSHVAQGGTNLSGGQKQRISIARAIFKDPEIFIFDDSFSALDYKTDKKLRESLNEEASTATRIIVGQRIGTIKDADKIIVLEDGEIVGCGIHKDLLKNCDTYKQIALSQLSKEELE